eukprot:m.200 g.200  ORF g.200 m.200 type:complete len:63 (+) comp977_c0_seq1:187-375(+)
MLKRTKTTEAAKANLLFDCFSCTHQLKKELQYIVIGEISTASFENMALCGLVTSIKSFLQRA